jgi:hypothetical protein
LSNRLESDLSRKLTIIASQKGLKLDGETPAIYFEKLIVPLLSQYGCKPVVLIDEYDAPIISQIGNTELAKDIQSAMGTFYCALKATGENRRFTFITGITKFSQTSVFSKLNIIVDLPLDEDFIEICDFTLNELDSFIDDLM